jgi:asparagine synthase (glutamine-hydrolysing)
MKLRGLDEKRILRDWAQGRIAQSVVERRKQPYRAPDAPSFFGPKAPSYARDLLEPGRLRESGVFDTARVAGLVRRCEAGKATGFGENHALIAILSTQLWHETFIRDGTKPEPLALESADVVLRDGTETAGESAGGTRK